MLSVTGKEISHEAALQHSSGESQETDHRLTVQCWDTVPMSREKIRESDVEEEKRMYFSRTRGS